jgi:hypothetical protein
MLYLGACKNIHIMMPSRWLDKRVFSSRKRIMSDDTDSRVINICKRVTHTVYEITESIGF